MTAIHRMLVTDCVAQTSGRGLWSSTVRSVTIHALELESDFTEGHDAVHGLCALFRRPQWDTDKHGLIYTDEQWLREFRQRLVEMGFSASAAKSVQYTEQGMQGSDYVSLECSEKFAVEFCASPEAFGRRGASRVSREFSKRIAAFRAGKRKHLNF